MKVESYEQIVDYLRKRRIAKFKIGMNKFEELNGLPANTCFYLESKKRVSGLGTLLPILKVYDCGLYVNGVALMDAMQFIELLEREKEKRGLSCPGLARLVGVKSLDLTSYKKEGIAPRMTRFLTICKVLEWEVEIDG